MKSTFLKLALALAMISGLSGCIMYVGPHTRHTDTGHEAKPTEEKPAETLNKT